MMRIPRIYHPTPLQGKTHCYLSEDASHHVGRVLRMQVGQALELFDGSNAVFPAIISEINRKQVGVQLSNSMTQDNESPLDIHLGQVISRGDRMEFTIQKSVELGVSAITPLWSTRCGVKLDSDRMQKKITQWQKIAISACEQCGRNRIPLVYPLEKLENWCAIHDGSLKLNLHPRAKYSIKTLPYTPSQSIRLLIGSEGGLSQTEILKVQQQGFIDVLLGPRVLRTETAALSAITALQVCFGDLA